MSRRDLLEIYRAGIAATDGRRRVAATLATEPPPAASVRVFAVGKAAPAMALGALDAWGEAVTGGLVVTRRGQREVDLDRRDGWRQLESAHPVPDASSLAAGEALREAIGRCPAADGCLFLISGGSSSLVEVPAPGVTLSLLQRANDWLIASGLPIGEVNAVRRGLSAIKDGRLAGALGARPVLALYLSDVPDDCVWDIGSGLLAAAPPAALPAGLPDWIEAHVDREPRPLSSGPRIDHRIVGSVGTALTACEAEARRRGSRVVRHARRLDLDTARAADLIVETLLREGPGVHLWGGETTVRLPSEPGRGGRNQHLALACAIRLAGRDGIGILCGATDGNDGPGEDAGGLVDGGTVARGELGGLDAGRCLAAADAGSFLAAAGDLVSTGPTGTNVNDLVIGARGGAS